ncbi:MAG: DeoR/GlpR transcriptional regulator [Caldilineaceae bacterium]|nr:DeoR/GlpR transcriptional regulator [Caldilineaceae bacterium]
MNNEKPSLSLVERQDALRRRIQQQSRITVAEICAEFAVSEATARRDLDALTEQGDVRRVHGGALALRSAPPEPPVLQRTVEQADLKKRIGQVAAAEIVDGETIFLGSGTTVYEVARHLAGREVTVITNSLLVINELSQAPKISLISLGGAFRRSELSFIGHITEQSLAELRADRVIIGIRAVDPEEGLTNDYLAETRTDRAILRIGRQVILVADHTKIGRVSTAFVAPVAAIHTLVTTREIDSRLVAPFESKGVQVRLA